MLQCKYGDNDKNHDFVILTKTNPMASKAASTLKFWTNLPLGGKHRDWVLRLQLLPSQSQESRSITLSEAIQN